MHLTFQDFDGIDFHDAYIEHIQIQGNVLLWTLEAVNISPEIPQNPHSCWMRAGTALLTFRDFAVTQTVFLEESAFWEALQDATILGANPHSVINGRKRIEFSFSLMKEPYFLEALFSCTELILKFDSYPDKAWHEYWRELDVTKQFLEEHRESGWMSIRSTGKSASDLLDSLSAVLKEKLADGHPLQNCFSDEDTETLPILAVSEDGVLCSLCDGTCAVIQLQTMQFRKYPSVESALKAL